MAKRAPKHLRCRHCKLYCDLRCAGTIKVDGARYHTRCLLAANPKRRKKQTGRRLSPEAAAEIFGGRTAFWEGIGREDFEALGKATDS